jgi:hypothetical protein
MPQIRRKIAATALLVTVCSCAQSFQIAEVFKSLKGLPVGQTVSWISIKKNPNNVVSCNFTAIP